MIDFSNMQYGLRPYYGNNIPTDFSKILYHEVLPFDMNIGFSHGNKDDWCAWTWYINQRDGTFIWYQPCDTFYFEIAMYIQDAYPNIRLYDDFALICRWMTDTLTPVPQKDIIHNIHGLSRKYNKCNTDMDVAYCMFMHVYYGFIAEEYYNTPNGSPSLFGKYIKLNGLYDLLIEGKSIFDAANDCRGKGKGRLLKQQMIDRRIISEGYERNVIEPYVSDSIDFADILGVVMKSSINL